VSSVTGISTIAPSASISQAAGQTISYRDQLRNLLITHLKIDATLTDRSQIPKLPLQDCYTRYKAVTAAIAKYDLMVAERSLDGTGIPADLVDKEIIEVFLGKSLFYEWKKVFKGISEHHSQMCRWLERHPKAKADIDVWGIAKEPGETFTRFDLKAWLANGCTLNVKGKSKAVEASDAEMGSEKESDGDLERQSKKQKKKGKLEDSSKVEKKQVDTGPKKTDKHRKKVSRR
jgi:hypothetical protein